MDGIRHGDVEWIRDLLKEWKEGGKDSDTVVLEMIAKFGTTPSEHPMQLDLEV